MFDPGKAEDRLRLQAEIKSARQDQEGFRSNAVKMLREYAGSMYAQGEGYADTEKIEVTLMNLLFQTADIMVQSLVAQNPQCLVSTEHEELVSFAYIFERAVNNLSEEIDLQSTLSLAILDAYFSQGMVKVYNADGGDVFQFQNSKVDPGRPFAERLSRDDYVYQPAQEWSKVSWIEHTYMLTREGLKDSRFDQRLVRKLRPQSRNSVESDPRAESISNPRDSDADGYRDLFVMKEVYLPFDGHQVVTFGQGVERPVGVQEYDFQGYSPYHPLSFSDMVDNVSRSRRHHSSTRCTT